MDRFIEIDLVKITYTTDEIGQQVGEEETIRAVGGALYSASRQEWQAAAQAGLNPECMVFLRDRADYEGESVAEIDGARYEIYRTYLTNDGGIELYLKKSAGVST